MTSRRRLLILGAALLSACAALPDDAPVVEQLDEDTGLTVARLGRPVELYRETFRKSTAGKFAFLGPFETNQMGKRDLFLWIALPLENPDGPAAPIVKVNGTVLALGEPGRKPDFAGLTKTPYKIPMSWISMFYYRVDAATVSRLGEAQNLDIAVTETTSGGTLKTEYAAQLVDDPRLREFAAQHQAD